MLVEERAVAVMLSGGPDGAACVCESIHNINSYVSVTLLGMHSRAQDMKLNYA